MKLLALRLSAGTFDFLLLCLFLWGITETHGYPRIAMIVVVIALWFEICWRSKGTPGKIIFSLGVAYTSRSNVVLREFVGKTASYATLGLGFIPVLFPDRKALEDYIAGTNVVPWQRSKALVDTLRIGTAIAVSVSLAVIFTSGSSPAPSGATPASTAVRPWSVSDAMPAVMTINVYKGRELQAQGSGFFIDSNGSAITNVHVLRDGDSAQVLLADGRKFPITSVVAFDEAHDLTLYKVGTGNVTFPKVTLGASSDVNVGDRVIVIGSPEGLNNTVSEGILSALRPKTKDEEATLQVSAAISPGSSGGPVFDGAGGVIGVAQSTLEEGQNLNFAIPVEAVVALIHAPAANLTPAAFYSHMAGRPDPEETSSEGEETDPETAPAKPSTPAAPKPTPPARSGHDVTATFSSNGNGK